MRYVSTQLLAKLQAEELVCFVILDIKLGSTIFRYTDCDIPLVVDDHTYIPTALEPGSAQDPVGEGVASFNFRISSNTEASGYDNLKEALRQNNPPGSSFLARLVFLNTSYYAAYHVNTLTNSGFESGVMGDWTLSVGTGCTANASIESSGAYKGTYCCKVTITDGWGDAEHVQDILLKQNISPAIEAGYLYDLSFAAKAAASRRIAADVGPTGGNTHPMFYNVDLTTSWQFFNVPFIAPSAVSAGNAYVLFYLAREDSNDDVYIDHVRFSNSLYPITIFKGYLDQCDVDPTGWIDVEVVSALASWNTRTTRRQSSLCRYQDFKGEECQYSGGETWCDRTYDRCVALSNTAHFGGFRWLPSIVSKTLYWGRLPTAPGWHDLDVYKPPTSGDYTLPW